MFPGDQNAGFFRAGGETPQLFPVQLRLYQNAAVRRRIKEQRQGRQGVGQTAEPLAQRRSFCRSGRKQSRRRRTDLRFRRFCCEKEHGFAAFLFLTDSAYRTDGLRPGFFSACFHWALV